MLTEKLHSPLKSDELQVLRAQYEKEGPYVGVQTKFNYAWVSYDDEEDFDLDGSSHYRA